MSLYCDRNIHDGFSTGKIPENTRPRLVFSLGIFPVEMMPFMFLSLHRDTQKIFHLLKRIRFETFPENLESTSIFLGSEQPRQCYVIRHAFNTPTAKRSSTHHSLKHVEFTALSPVPSNNSSNENSAENLSPEIGVRTIPIEEKRKGMF